MPQRSGQINLFIATLGYALFVIGNSFILREPTSLFPNALLLGELTTRALTYVPFALTTLILGVIFLRLNTAPIKETLIASTGLFIAAFLLLLFPSLTTIIPADMVLFGMYSAVVFTGWICCAMMLTREDLWMFLIVSSIISALGSYAVTIILIPLSGTIAFAAISIASLALLWISIFKTHPEKSTRIQKAQSIHLIRNVFSGYGSLILLLGTLGFVSNLSRIIFEVRSIDEALQAEMTAVILAGIVLLILVFLAKISMNPMHIIIASIPVVSIMCLLVPITGSALHIALLGVATTCFTVGLLLVQIISADYGNGDVSRAVGCYNLVAGSVCVFSIAGFFAPLPLLSEYAGLPNYATAALICLAVLSITLAAERIISDLKNAAELAATRSADEAAFDAGEVFDLTPREKEVLALMANGRDIPAIAKMLFISQNTVRTHCKHIFKKMGVHTRQECLDKLGKPAN